jgi:NitT/TauT family transport system substrate-binding protein
VWFEGRDSTSVAKTPTCLLRQITQDRGKVRAAYVPDAANGTRIFAGTATWVNDPAADPDDRLKPFAITSDAQSYTRTHPGSAVIDYQGALRAR